jgi:dynein assembly factor 1
MTEDFFKKLLRSDFRLYYSTKELNDKLYIHFKGFHRIENLHEFTGLKVLYAESNAIEKIEGLEALTELRCLYLHENCIRQIEGLETLSALDSLNLSDNFIETISGLEGTPKLNTLLLQRNRIGVHGLSDLQGLLGLENLSVLDLSNNKIDDEAVLPEILERMGNLRVLHFNGNPVCKKIPNYRKVMIARISSLLYLDDRPVFEEDRRFAEAFVRGGITAEREERKVWAEEKEAERMRQHIAFQEMVSQARREPAAPTFFVSQEEHGQSSGSTASSLMDHLSSGLNSSEATEESEEELPPLISPLSQID